MMLDLDGFRMDKGLQITADAEGEWTYNIRKCAAAVGKHNFFIPGEIVGGNQFSAVYIVGILSRPNKHDGLQIV